MTNAIERTPTSKIKELKNEPMTSNEEQQFLNELDKKLWTSADKLRSTLAAAQYKHTPR